MAKKIPKNSGILCFYFSGQPRNTLCWEYRSASGEFRSGTEDDPIPGAKKDRVWLAIPAEQCLFYCVTGGKMSAEALKWQLEGTALGDVDTLHLTVLARTAQENHLVAVDPPRLQAALDAVKQRGFTPDYALPDVLMLPHGQAFRLDEQWLARTEPFSGVSVAVADLPLLAAQDSALCERVKEHETCGRLTAEAEKISLPSLLHGGFSPAVNWRNGLRSLTAALFLSGCCLSAIPLYHGWQLNLAADRFREQTLQHYQHYFPQERPAKPAQALLAHIHQKETHKPTAGLLVLLTECSALLSNIKEIPLQTLEWDAKRQQLSLHFAKVIPADNELITPEGYQLARQGDSSIIISRKP
ncbi:type II secretion system protein GspL [Erwinia tasmaniensis]|uniref:General secretion pathway protein L n=1 Tax=Erwinia tasmaniensis (strain DSM 17950 / CFBP 7177 / CIP 109463 / NCPPB 4357 / Et1/99) TaxID=465817 RepID=B2VI00_ERWT9|nr:type II secretion system protein GspL [Erwinia tasmaniensis]CAO95830.1 General secretion pathway protein L [Erwinia tasmaniensis Et1/99]